jgi:electron transfer flavoprotein beta subunit
MDIVVLVKQVADTNALIQVAGNGASIATKDINWIMNPYDELAVEEALRIKERHRGSVTAVTLGPDRAKGVLRTALAMGADRGMHVCDPAAEGGDALATGKILAGLLRTLPYDLIIAGHRGVDEDNYQVPAAVSRYLNIPLISFVVEQKIDSGKITCKRTVDSGFLVVEAELPVLLTTQRKLNEPRYASLPNIMKAKKKPLEGRTLADLGIDPQSVGAAGRKVDVVSLMHPPVRPTVRMIEGNSAGEKAAALMKALVDVGIAP